MNEMDKFKERMVPLFKIMTNLGGPVQITPFLEHAPSAYTPDITWHEDRPSGRVRVSMPLSQLVWYPNSEAAVAGAIKKDLTERVQSVHTGYWGEVVDEQKPWSATVTTPTQIYESLYKSDSELEAILTVWIKTAEGEGWKPKRTRPPYNPGNLAKFRKI